MKTIFKKIGKFFKYLWEKLKTPYAKIVVGVLSLIILGLSGIAIALAIKKRPDNTNNNAVPERIDLNQFKSDLEDKRNEWQSYLDNTRPLTRR